MKRAGILLLTAMAIVPAMAQVNLAMGTMSMVIKPGSVVVLPGTLTLPNASNRIHASGTLQLSDPSPSAISALSTNGIVNESTALAGGLRWNVKQAGTYTFPLINADGEAVRFVATPSTADPGDRYLRVSTYGTSPANTPYPPGVTNVDHQGEADHSPGMPDRFWRVVHSSPTPLAVRFNYAPSEDAANGTAEMRVQYWVSAGWQNGLPDQTQTGTREVQLNNFIFGVGGDWTFSLQRAPVALSLKVLLDGPYVPGSGLMSDGLRTASLIPLTEPYTALGFDMHGGSGLGTVPGFLNTTGNDALVDWVLVELRAAGNNSQVVATVPALLQRDGDVVGRLLTPSPLVSVAPGNYFVALRHRNHLGVMTAAPVAVSTATPLIDFRSIALATYGTEARRTQAGMMTLWSGDALRDGVIKYTGSGNDRDPILTRIGGSTPNNTVSGYHPEDVNMDGVVKYTGSGNDRDPLLTNIGSTVPTNTRSAQLP